MAYTVARRTREIGIRMALGAGASAIGWLVIREVLVIATVGIALALPVAWWLSRSVESGAGRQADRRDNRGRICHLSWALPRSRALFHRRAPPVSTRRRHYDTSNAECRC